jgi:hypothetical protein
MQFLAGLGFCVLAVAIAVAQVALKHLVTPWYLPALTTLGACLLVLSFVRRRTAVRLATLLLVVVLAGLEWFFFAVMARLPEYHGPATVGRPIPAFQTALADGRPFTSDDVRDGKASVIVFFRGRW